MKLWVDDERYMPRDYDVHVRTMLHALIILNTRLVTEISLDHDLGDEDECGTGYMIAQWIEEAAFYDLIPPLEWHIHSMNSVGRERMRAALENADRFWTEKNA